MFVLRVILLVCLLLTLVACSEPIEQVKQLKGHTMGTTYSILWSPQAGISSIDLKTEIDILLLDLNRQMSTYDINSEISHFNQSQPPFSVDVSDDFANVMHLSMELNELTGGYFDVSVGPLVNLWGFGPDKSLVLM